MRREMMALLRLQLGRLCACLTDEELDALEIRLWNGIG